MPIDYNPEDRFEYKRIVLFEKVDYLALLSRALQKNIEDGLSNYLRYQIFGGDLFPVNGLGMPFNIYQDI